MVKCEELEASGCRFVRLFGAALALDIPAASVGLLCWIAGSPVTSAGTGHRVAAARTSWGFVLLYTNCSTSPKAHLEWGAPSGGWTRLLEPVLLR